MSLRIRSQYPALPSLLWCVFLLPFPSPSLSHGGLLEHAGHIPTSGTFPLPFPLPGSPPSSWPCGYLSYYCKYLLLCHLHEVAFTPVLKKITACTINWLFKVFVLLFFFFQSFV